MTEGTLSRRAFVKGCVLASAAGMAGLGAEALTNPLAITSHSPFRRVDYLGATVIGGPAPQGLPLLPLRISARGEVEGNAQPEGVKGGVLDWYRYCGHAALDALQSDFAPRNEALRFAIAADKRETLGALRAAGRPGDAGWFLPKLGEVARADDFERVGWGASVTWRDGAHAVGVPAIILKVEPDALSFHAASERLVRDAFLAPTADGAALLAYVAYCKHFCCTPGWHESPLAASPKYNAEDQIFCTCHGSVYDPLRIKGDFFMLQDSPTPPAGATTAA